MLAVRNLHTLPGNVDRSKGDKIPLSGTGLVVLGRPPLLAEVRLGDKDSSSGIPLAAGTIISQRFDEFWLFHPYTETGVFRLGILQGDDWIDQPEQPERLRFSGTRLLPSVTGQKWGVQLRNAAKPIESGNGLRIARVQRVVVSAPAGAAKLTLARMETTDVALAPIGVGCPVITDGRVAQFYADGFASQCQIQGDANMAAFSIPESQFDARWIDCSHDTNCEFAVDVLLLPGQALRVEQPASAVGMAFDVSFQFTEEPFN